MIDGQGWWLLGKMILSLLHISEPIKIPRLHDVSLSLSYITHAMTIREMLKQSRVGASLTPLPQTLSSPVRQMHGSWWCR